MRVSQNFKIQEFVPRVIFKTYGENSAWFIDPRIITLMQTARTETGESIIVNNWHMGNHLQNRGYRTPGTKIGAYYSQHKRGAAVDFNIRGWTSKEVFEWVMKSPDFFIALGVTTIEDWKYTPTWTHLDLRWRPSSEGIVVVKP